MKDKKVKKIGTVVGYCRESFLKRFQNINRLRSEAHYLLDRCSEMDEDAWKDLETEYDLSPNLYKYQVNHKDGSIEIIGYRRSVK